MDDLLKRMHENALEDKYLHGFGVRNGRNEHLFKEDEIRKLGEEYTKRRRERSRGLVKPAASRFEFDWGGYSPDAPGVVTVLLYAIGAALCFFQGVLTIQGVGGISGWVQGLAFIPLYGMLCLLMRLKWVKLILRYLDQIS